MRSPPLAPILRTTLAIAASLLVASLGPPHAAAQPPTWEEQPGLVPSDGPLTSIAPGGAQLGVSVAVSGDTAILGTPGSYPQEGAAYVFVRAGGRWTQQAKLTPGGGTGPEAFGSAVAIDGDTAVVGGPTWDDWLGITTDLGRAHVFTRTGATWTEQQTLLGDAETPGGQFGAPVAVHGDTVVVGATEDGGGPYQAGPGAVWVFTRSGGTWAQQQRLTVDPMAEMYFGQRIALGGDTLLVLADRAITDATTTLTDIVHVFARTGGTWTPVLELPTLGDAGNPFVPGVSVDGDTAMLGGSSTQVLGRSGGAWTAEPSLPGANDVAVSGDTAVLGTYDAQANDSPFTVFARTGGAWAAQQTLFAGMGVQYYPLALSGHTLLAGEFTGARVFARSDGAGGGGGAGAGTLTATVERGGCACGAGGPTGSDRLAPLLLAGLLLAARRRRATSG